MYLSVVIPSYNEANAIRSGKLARVITWLADQPIDSELLVVDDGSRDESAQLAHAAGARVLTIPHAGKAAALVAGIRNAVGEVVLLSDMDQATPIGEASRLLDSVKQGADVVIGSRGLVRPGAPIGRYVLSWGQVVLRTLLIGLRLTDTQCGFKACTRRAALETVDRLHLYHPDRLGTVSGPSVTSGFDVEFLFVARRLGFVIREVRVAWNYQETRRVNLARDARRGISDLIQIRIADWKGEYSSLGAPAISSNGHQD